jgi:serine/threonine protein kinase
MIFDYYPVNLINYVAENRHSMNMEDFKRIMIGVIKGVDYLHRNGVA